MGDPRTRRPEFQETYASRSQVCEIPGVLEKAPTQTVGVSSLILDKLESAETILETWGFIRLAMAKEALFTSYSGCPARLLPTSALQ